MRRSKKEIDKYLGAKLERRQKHILFGNRNKKVRKRGFSYVSENGEEGSD